MLPHTPSSEQILRTLLPEHQTSLSSRGMREAAARMLRALGRADLAESQTPRTIRFYRSREMVDPPIGRTSKARYTRRHVLQVVLARLSGATGETSLDEALLFSRSDDSSICRRIDQIRRKGEEQAPPPPSPSGRKPSYKSLDLGDGAYLLLPQGHPMLTPGQLQGATARIREALKPWEF